MELGSTSTHDLLIEALGRYTDMEVKLLDGPLEGLGEKLQSSIVVARQGRYCS